ncbi:hypothetical protein J6A31_03070 [bacterium]|nr:hypothetical protein [bacterium]
MNVQSISAITNTSKQNHFTGITKVISNDYIETIDCGGGQGELDIYEKTVEYRPFKDETQSEIKAAIQKLKKQDEHGDANRDYGSNASWTKIKVVLGKRLDCTKAAAKDIFDTAV